MLRPAETRQGKRAGTGVALVAAAVLSVGAFPGPAQANLSPAPAAATTAPLQPVRLTSEEAARLESAFEAAAAGSASRFETARIGLSHPVAQSLAEWKWLVEQARRAPAERLIAFLAKHPDWPRTATLRAELERNLGEALAPADLVAWMEANPAENGPALTGNGFYHYGEALIALGRIEEGRRAIRTAFVERGVEQRLEDRILARHDGWLSQTDFEARVERLLWEGEASAAARLLSRLGERARAVAVARIRLQRRDSRVEAALAALPDDARDDAGVLYDRIRWRRRVGRDEDTWPMLIAAPRDGETLVDPERWWSERHLQARKALKAGEPLQAYEMVVGHGMTSGTGFADGEWLAGWIALRFLDRPQDALNHFLTLEAGVSTPISKGRAFYWAGRAAAEMGLLADARRYYREAAQRSFTYYGQLAMEELGGSEAYVSLPAHLEPSALARREMAERSFVQALGVLDQIDAERDLRRFVYHLSANPLPRADDYALLSDLLSEIGITHLALRVAKYGLRAHDSLASRAYPQIDLPELDGEGLPEFAMVLGLSRQESEFNPEAVSHAGARGLMQLMPATAQITARRHGLSYQPSWLTTRPEYNATLGQRHLADLLDEFEGSYVLVIAAYNAGGRRSEQWVREYGDPRAHGVDVIDWVELIPFSETRNYVQRVLENTMIYRTILAGQPLVASIATDLVRGRSGVALVETAQRPDVIAATEADAALTPAPAVADEGPLEAAPTAMAQRLSLAVRPRPKPLPRRLGAPADPLLATTPARTAALWISPEGAVRLAAAAPEPAMPARPVARIGDEVLLSDSFTALSRTAGLLAETVEAQLQPVDGSPTPTYVLPLDPPDLPRPTEEEPADSAENKIAEGDGDPAGDAAAADGETWRVPDGCVRYVVTLDGTGHCLERADVPAPERVPEASDDML